MQKPGRYTGGEINSVQKDISRMAGRIALIFPDIYEIGMSNLGLKILYEEINSQDNLYAERVFCPWVDMEKYLRDLNIPLFSLETHSPLTEFDIIGFSLEYELCYTNVLNILSLAGIPLWHRDRLSGAYPLVLAGGQMACVPEPLAPFIDLFIIGDGEEIVVQFMEYYLRYKDKLTKNDFLKQAAAMSDCIYVPSLYHAGCDSKKRMVRVTPAEEGIPRKIKRHVYRDFAKHYGPVAPVIPLIRTVHDRATVEIMRGCPRSCRFCQAGSLYKPVRRRDCDIIVSNADKLLANTGYQELGLLSLSATDYKGIDTLVASLLERGRRYAVSISLPSTRIDSFSLELIDQISRVKKTGLTLAPEAASARMLAVIDKGYGPMDVITVAEQAHKLGYRVIKLYFMIGLPGETREDLDEMAKVLYRMGKIGFKQINVSIATFIPKAYTPFQWQDFISLDNIGKKQRYLKQAIKARKIKLKFHHPATSFLEAVFSRGDRLLAPVIYRAYQKGCRFDQWDECFRFDLWLEAFRECDIAPESYHTGWRYDDGLPWDHINAGTEKEFLRKRSIQAQELIENSNDICVLE